MVFELCSTNSVGNHFLAELRDVEIQKDSLRFRRNLERIGELLAYELSKSFQYKPHVVKTPLGESPTYLIKNQLVVATILRAGLPFFNGFLNFFDDVPSGFVGAFRIPGTEGKDLGIQVEYVTTPDLNGKDLVVVDPMLATGKSLVKSLNALLDYGDPASINVVSVICAPEGLDYVRQNTTREINLWTGCIDKELNEKDYIIPGLGDAGDLAFGQKV